MDKNKKILIGSVIGLIAVIVLALLLSRVPALSPAGGAQNEAQPSSPAAIKSQTYEPVSAGISVPGVGAQTSSDVAKPTAVKTIGSDGISARTFSISVNGDTVNPEKIIVKTLDIVNITFSAVDKSYTFIQPDYGLTWTVPMGGSKSFQFQGASPGQYKYYCGACGGPGSGPVGYFVVVPKQ